jgi:hypothetical protein
MALKILNPILLVLFINQAVTALLSEQISPKTFEIFHKGGGTILIVLAILHIVLNFNWFKATYLRK